MPESKSPWDVCCPDEVGPEECVEGVNGDILRDVSS
jgi:hypothetical protein